MKKLAQREEQIMQILWELDAAFVKEIVEKFPDPKPHYNSVSTMVRILETKGYIGHKEFGKSHQYFPLVSKDDYQSQAVDELAKNYFNNSFSDMMAYFAKEEKISEDEVKDILKMIKNKK